jgi:hypothetical protein
MTVDRFGFNETADGRPGSERKLLGRRGVEPGDSAEGVRILLGYERRSDIGEAIIFYRTMVTEA